MKFIAKVCLALLLAITISFGGLSSQAQAAPLPPVSVNADSSINQILSNISFQKKYSILVINKTDQTLSRVGAYNDSGNWPVGDIAPNTAQPVELEGSSFNNSFSFSANYGTDAGKNFQFVAVYPYLGSRKIGLTAINQYGNAPAKAAWDRTSDNSDQFVNNSPYKASASIRGGGSSTIWVFQVEKA